MEAQWREDAVMNELLQQDVKMCLFWNNEIEITRNDPS